MAVVLTVGCSSLKTPATAVVAVSKAAVENATGAGGAEFAPVEMNSAREKLALANKAMVAKDYKLAVDLASQAQADAKLAQGKSNSAKAQTAADALQDDVRILREELDNPNVASYASLEMKQAGDALAQANAAASGNDSAEKIDKLAYLAKQKIALTQEAQARAAQLEAQLADLAAKKTERGMVITPGDVLFGTDLARLNVEGMRTAEKRANALQKNPQRTVLVDGFTDSTGTAAHNQDFERRATAVRGALQELGVARERVAIRGYGETYPIAANDTAQNRQLNRRVEIVLSDDTGKISPR